jgi:hypothetical protein
MRMREGVNDPFLKTKLLTRGRIYFKEDFLV